MKQKDFWKLITKTKLKSGGNGQKQADLLIQELKNLEVDEIISFQHIFKKLLDEAYDYSLWAAAFIIRCGCSEDVFLYFRAWLVGQGEDIYYNVLENPEFLLNVVDNRWSMRVEALLYVARKAFELKTGKVMPFTEQKFPGVKGEKWHEEDLEKKYPLLFRKFGDCESY